MKTRIEKDELGEKEIPSEAYYGIQTLRAKENFDIVQKPISRQLIKALAIIKKAAANANYDAGLIKKDVCDAICMSCDEILNGRLHGQFITDLIQGGAGTSMNMNANEVIANRANEMLGSQKGLYDKVHPIDHVNLSQSTNDVLPTAGKIAAIHLTKKLLVEMKKLSNAYRDLEDQYKDVITIGKTHLQDGALITFGQIFKALRFSVERDIKNIESAMERLLEINMGGTLVGTGESADPKYVKKIVKYIVEFSGENFYQSKNLVDCTRHVDSFSWLSKAVMNFALNVHKNANDLRLMSCCYKTIVLPEIQSGSAMNPGKINPVVPEMLVQVVYYMEGNDLTISRSVAAGEMEFNVNLPIIFACLFENLNFIRRAICTLREKCLEGLKVIPLANPLELDGGILIALQPKLGYQTCKDIVLLSAQEHLSIQQVLLQHGYITKEELEAIISQQVQIAAGK